MFSEVHHPLDEWTFREYEAYGWKEARGKDEAIFIYSYLFILAWFSPDQYYTYKVFYMQV